MKFINQILQFVDKLPIPPTIIRDSLKIFVVENEKDEKEMTRLEILRIS
jgi:hypothetical protein